MSRLIPLLLLILVGATACFGSNSASSTTNMTDATANGVVPSGSLRLTVRLLPGKCAGSSLAHACKNASGNLRHYSLTCSPPGGTMPNPPAACAAITSYLRNQNHVSGCPEALQAPGSTARLTGTFAHRPFHLKLEAGFSWCGQPKPILSDFWTLSAFPCSAQRNVMREAGAHLAQATGCKKAD
jgi:hypothetical protein